MCWISVSAKSEERALGLSLVALLVGSPALLFPSWGHQRKIFLSTHPWKRKGEVFTLGLSSEFPAQDAFYRSLNLLRGIHLVVISELIEFCFTLRLGLTQGVPVAQRIVVLDFILCVQAY
jgi:hypothetical protein